MRGKPSGHGLPTIHHDHCTSDRDRKTKRSSNFLPESPVREDRASGPETAPQPPVPPEVFPVPRETAARHGATSAILANWAFREKITGSFRLSITIRCAVVVMNC